MYWLIVLEGPETDKKGPHHPSRAARPVNAVESPLGKGIQGSQRNRLSLRGDGKSVSVYQRTLGSYSPRVKGEEGKVSKPMNIPRCLKAPGNDKKSLASSLPRDVAS